MIEMQIAARKLHFQLGFGCVSRHSCLTVCPDTSGNVRFFAHDQCAASFCGFAASARWLYRVPAWLAFMRHSGSVLYDQVSAGDRCKAAMNSRQSAEATADGGDSNRSLKEVRPVLCLLSESDDSTNDARIYLNSKVCDYGFVKIAVTRQALSGC